MLYVPLSKRGMVSLWRSDGEACVRGDYDEGGVRSEEFVNDTAPLSPPFLTL